MDKWEGLVAVVTGASSGIGLAIAKELAQKGMKVAALARREDRLKELESSFQGKGLIRGYMCDVSETDSLHSVFTTIEKDLGPIRVLVNNAGMAPRMDLLDIDLDIWKKTFNVNLFGMFGCIREVLKSAKAKSSKELIHIININSIAGQYYFPEANMSVYSSSKHCVTNLSRALIKRISEEKLNIRVTSLSPGVVETEIRAAAGVNSDYSGVPHLSPENVAEATVAALSVPPNVVISELTIKPQGEIW